MNDDLFPYYERELLFIRQLTQEFSKRFPRAAGRLLLEANASRDPQVERLLESFALLNGCLQQKLEDEFPELSDALLQVLYPHFLAPIPSLGIVQFAVDPVRAQLPAGFTIERHSRLHTPPIENVPCKYRTCYPVTLWPIKITEARFQGPPFPPGLEVADETAAALVLRIEAAGQLKLSELTLDKLRLYLAGEGAAAALYEFLFNHALQVVYRVGESDTLPRPVVFRPQSCLHQVGFERDDALLPYPPQAMAGYRVLTEFFAFPSKCWFFDLSGWRQVRQRGLQSACEVVVFFDRTLKSLEQEVSPATFRLGCTPIVNLFEQVAEPIVPVPGRSEYRIVLDANHAPGYEVYSVEAVTTTDPATQVSTEFQPFYSFQHGQGPEHPPEFWYPSRRPSLAARDQGSEVMLNFVDLAFVPRTPSQPVLSVRTVCTNRDLPGVLRKRGTPHFELEAAAPLAGIRCLVGPTDTLRPSPKAPSPWRDRGRYWPLISQLSLNHLSLLDSHEGLRALKEILRLYDFADAGSGQQAKEGGNARQCVDGLTGLSCHRVIGRGADPTGPFCRGLEVTLTFDEEKYRTGWFPFAAALERFLASYVSRKSFVRMVARTQQRPEFSRHWPPRNGELPLL